MKLGQLVEYNQKKYFSSKRHAEIEAGRLVPDLFLFFKKLKVRQNQVVCSLVSIYFDSPQLGT